MRINTKVRLKESCARWHLDHLDLYFVAGDFTRKPDYSYETETILHLICCLGEPVYGKIIEINHFIHGPYYYLVQLKIGKYKAKYWVEKKHVEVLD